MSKPVFFKLLIFLALSLTINNYAYTQDSLLNKSAAYSIKSHNMLTLGLGFSYRWETNKKYYGYYFTANRIWQLMEILYLGLVIDVYSDTKESRIAMNLNPMFGLELFERKISLFGGLGGFGSLLVIGNEVGFGFGALLNAKAQYNFTQKYSIGLESKYILSSYDLFNLYFSLKL